VFEGCPPERPGRPRSCKAGGRRQRRSQMDDHRPPWGHRTRLTRVARPFSVKDLWWVDGFCGAAKLLAMMGAERYRKRRDVGVTPIGTSAMRVSKDWLSCETGRRISFLGRTRISMWQSGCWRFSGAGIR